ncbi:hypothetical protein [Gracilibacillus dipsosauri]|uniref:hypothetical protein n=1 Tax=Gracilibacillus dipsosauri TaxID=178340 RepID=UPI0024095885
MNTLDYFRTLPQERLIGDKYEGIKYLKQLNGGKFTFKHNEKEFFLVNQRAHAYPTDKTECNIYCLYGGDENLLERYYRRDHGILPLGETFHSMEYMAVINNPKEFMRRLILYLEMAGFYPKYSPVQYYDKNKYQGKLDQFCKSKEYEGQNEFRIYVENMNNKYMHFEIGDLSDICHIARTEPHLNLRYEAFDSEYEGRQVFEQFVEQKGNPYKGI